MIIYWQFAKMILTFWYLQLKAQNTASGLTVSGPLIFTDADTPSSIIQQPPTIIGAGAIACNASKLRHPIKKTSNFKKVSEKIRFEVKVVFLIDNPGDDQFSIDWVYPIPGILLSDVHWQSQS